MVNWTTVHGLSTIKNLDVEKGKHDTLIKNKDDFYAFLAGALHTSASSTSWAYGIFNFNFFNLYSFVLLQAKHQEHYVSDNLLHDFVPNL